MSECLIITATLEPNSVFVSQQDSTARKKEYLKGLNYYLSNFGGEIYFIENSSYDFEKDHDFQQLFINERVTLMQFPESTAFEKGKGFQEFEMLDSAVEQLASKHNSFIKVTGRYVVTNFNQLKNQPCNDMVIDRHKKKGVAITSFFKCNTQFYLTHLKGEYKNANDSGGVFIEHVVYSRLLNLKKSHLNLFKSTPLYQGLSLSLIHI